MRKVLLAFVMTVFVLGVQATNGEAENPKPTNYKEVISKIGYPETSKAQGIEGQVIVTLKVNKNGKVVNHRFDSYPCTDMRDAVKDVLKDLRFKAAKNASGEPVVGFIALPVNFKLTI